MTTQSNALEIPPERDTTPNLAESGIWTPPAPSAMELDDVDLLWDESAPDLDFDIPVDAASAEALPSSPVDIAAYDAEEAPFELVATPKSATMLPPKPASKPAAMSVPPPDVRVPGPERTTLLFVPPLRTRLWVSE
ncbi:MAG: hypothetical protein U0235_14800 [Polyangiaceae bacterium]